MKIKKLINYCNKKNSKNIKFEECLIRIIKIDNFNKNIILQVTDIGLYFTKSFIDGKVPISNILINALEKYPNYNLIKHKDGKVTEIDYFRMGYDKSIFLYENKEDFKQTGYITR